MAKIPDVTESETALLQQHKAQIKLPEDVEEEMERAANQRGYIKSAMLRTDPDAVSTNYVFQFLSANVADMFPRDPNFDVVLKHRMWGPSGPPPRLPVIADTLERLMNFHAEHGKFKHAMRDVVREAFTVPMGIVKLIWHEDFSRDPIGARKRDTDEVVARYARLHQEFKAKKFDKDDAEYTQLLDMSNSLRPVALSELDKELGLEENPLVVDEETGEIVDPRVDIIDRVAQQKILDPKHLPKSRTFQYFSFDLVELEDFRWDWTTTRFGDYWNARWVAHRVRMTHDEIIEKFRLDEEDAERLVPTEDESGEAIDDTQKHREDVEDNNAINTLDVWELQDAETRMVYVFTEHFYRYLDKYEPTATHEGFFTLFPLQFNSVAGEFLGISNVDLQRPLQDEINERRTHEKKYLRATLPRYVAAADAFSSAAEAQRVKSMEPFDLMVSQVLEDPNKKIFTIRADEVATSWFDLMKPLGDLQAMAGRPVSAIGGANPGVTATQTAFSSEQLGGRVSQSRTVFQDFMTGIGRAMAEILLQTTDELEAKYIVGDGAVLPMDNRDALFAQMNLEVSTFMDSAPNQDAMLERLEKVVQLGLALGRAPNPDMILKSAFEALKLPFHPNQMFIVPPQAAALGDGQAPGPDPGAAGQPISQTPAMASVPGRSQTVQNVAEAANPA